MLVVLVVAEYPICPSTGGWAYLDKLPNGDSNDSTS